MYTEYTFFFFFFFLFAADEERASLCIVERLYCDFYKLLFGKSHVLLFLREKQSEIRNFIPPSIYHHRCQHHGGVDRGLRKTQL